jgi:hypothetical protein
MRASHIQPCRVPAGAPNKAALNGFRQRALYKGINPVLYWTARTVLVPFFLLYLRMNRIGREHLPRSGPLLLAANHRSFLGMARRGERPSARRRVCGAAGLFVGARRVERGRIGPGRVSDRQARGDSVR